MIVMHHSLLMQVQAHLLPGGIGTEDAHSHLQVVLQARLLLRESTKKDGDVDIDQSQDHGQDHLPDI